MGWKIFSVLGRVWCRKTHCLRFSTGLEFFSLSNTLNQRTLVSLSPGTPTMLGHWVCLITWRYILNSYNATAWIDGITLSLLKSYRLCIQIIPKRGNYLARFMDLNFSFSSLSSKIICNYLVEVRMFSDSNDSFTYEFVKCYLGIIFSVFLCLNHLHSNQPWFLCVFHLSWWHVW